MARSTKANAVKSKAKTKSPKEESSKAVVSEKRPQMKLVAGQGEKPGEKKVSQRLIETIEKRKQAKAGTPGRVPGRRGRRPKALAEYIPNNNEEDNFSAENDFEGLEYDTGIRVKDGKDDAGFSMDRFDDFDEELNFDW